jgi:fructose-1,6-bisphosphatase/inositol monophosphatase family enzyme
VLPDAVVFGEEDGGELARDGLCFVIDPIDGTKNFMRGVPVFATLIGVLLDGEVVAGVASAPAMGERWDAALGAGARRNAEPVGVSAIDAVGAAHLLHGGLDRFSGDAARWAALQRLAEDAWRTRGFGEFWMHLLVAGGQAEAAFEDDLSRADKHGVAAPRVCCYEDRVCPLPLIDPDTTGARSKTTPGSTTMKRWRRSRASDARGWCSRWRWCCWW